jgi:hypothetical protein
MKKNLLRGEIELYRIRAKEGYNIILNDLGIKLRSNADKWTEVDEDLFNNSKDVQKVIALIIKDNGSNKTATKINTINNVVEVKQDVFVRGDGTFKNPPNVFVAEVIDEEVKINTEIKAKVVNKEQESVNNDSPILVKNVQEIEIPVVNEKQAVKVDNKVVVDNSKKAIVNNEKNNKKEDKKIKDKK